MPRHPSRKPPALALVPEPPASAGSQASAAPIPTPPEQPAQLLTVEQLGGILQVSSKAVYALASRGKIPANCIFRVGRLLRFKRVAVEAWLGSRGTIGGTA